MKVFLAKVELLRSMLTWIREQLVPMEFDARALQKVELASEEALVNIIQHAYQGRPEKIEISVKLHPKSHAEIILKDGGAPFDPSKPPQVDRSSSLEERKVGGLGIHFIHQNMDEVRYQRTHDQNILTLIIRSSRKE